MDCGGNENAVVVNNRISGNVLDNARIVYAGGFVTAENNEITSNVTDGGTAFSVGGFDDTLCNNVIWGNTSTRDDEGRITRDDDLELLV